MTDDPIELIRRTNAVYANLSKFSCTVNCSKSHLIKEVDGGEYVQRYPPYSGSFSFRFMRPNFVEVVGSATEGVCRYVSDGDHIYFEEPKEPTKVYQAKAPLHDAGISLALRKAGVGHAALFVGRQLNTWEGLTLKIQQSREDYENRTIRIEERFTRFGQQHSKTLMSFSDENYLILSLDYRVEMHEPDIGIAVKFDFVDSRLNPDLDEESFRYVPPPERSVIPTELDI
jgi:hypothetical protein